MTEPVAISMYQGEDWSQTLYFYKDTDQTIPLVFDTPVMDVRAKGKGGGLLATFDMSGEQLGLASIQSDGVLVLTMPYATTATMVPGSYPLDIFANVNGQRKAITKQGALELTITARITVDP